MSATWSVYGSLKRRSICAAGDLLFQGSELLLDVLGHCVVRLDLDHCHELTRIGCALGQRFPDAQVVADARGFLVEGGGVARVIPEIRSRDLPVELR